MLNFTEKIESQKILRLLSRSLPYYLKSWNDIDNNTGVFGSVDPKSFNMRSVGSSSPVIEYVLRPHLNVLCILGSYVYLNHTDLVSAIISKEDLTNRICRGVNWACETHVTGTIDVEEFLGRKRWGENWRSSHWASLLGLVSVFCKEILSKTQHRRIKEIVAFEADRFIDLDPPSGCYIDTKIEENAQDSMVIAWAINLNPGHANIEKWNQALKTWSINIASSMLDKTDHTEYFGSSVAASVSTQNMFPDLTAENHGFFTPEILAYGQWIVLIMASYSLNNQECPSYLERKAHQRTFDTLLRFCLPTGMIYSPGGNDMPMFIPRPMALAWGLWHNDPRALHMAGKLLSWMDTCLLTNRDNQGPWVFGFNQEHEGWELLFQSQVGIELAMLACLPFSKEHRFFSPGQIENAVDTKHIYPFVEVCYRRNIRTTRSVAWKAIGSHPLIGINVHHLPEIITPFRGALLGIPAVSNPVKSWKVAFHDDRLNRDGFDTFGRINYYDADNTKILERDLRVITWGDEGLVVLDRITALAKMQVEEQYLSPLYLVNDHWTGGSITFCSGSLRETFNAEENKYHEVGCPSFWASIQNHLLFQFVWGRSKGLYYIPGGERNAPPYWKNARVDMVAVRVDPIDADAGTVIYKTGYFVGAGKGPRSFKTTGTAGEFFKGLVIMDGKITLGID